MLSAPTFSRLRQFSSAKHSGPLEAIRKGCRKTALLLNLPIWLGLRLAIFCIANSSAASVRTAMNRSSPHESCRGFPAIRSS